MQFATVSGAQALGLFFLSALLAAPAAAALPFEGPSVALARASDRPLDDPRMLGMPAQTGHVVITEFMKDPSAVLDTRGEWIEVYNALPWRVNLQGWVLSDDAGSSHVISTVSGLRLGPGQYAVLGNNSDPTFNGGVQVDYVWTSFSLANGADQIILSRPDGTLVDRVAYDDGVLWPDLPGRSIALKVSARDANANDDPANWCHSSTPISGTNNDTGTPHQDNDACP
jgi:hypothetical protein